MLYLTLFSLIVFSSLISAVAGFLICQAAAKFTFSANVRHTAGIAAKVLIGCLTVKLLFGALFFTYMAVTIAAIALYIVFCRSSMSAVFNPK